MQFLFWEIQCCGAVFGLLSPKKLSLWFFFVFGLLFLLSFGVFILVPMKKT